MVVVVMVEVELDVDVLVLSLKRLKIEYETRPILSWLFKENQIHRCIEDMVRILEEISEATISALGSVLPTKEDKIETSFLRKIFSGEWLNVFTSKNNSLVENFKKSWDDREFDVAKKIAMQLLGYGSPFLAALLLKYLLPYFSQKIEPFVSDFLKHIGLSGGNSFEEIVSSSRNLKTEIADEDIISFLNENEHVLEDLIKKNPPLLNKLVFVVKQKILDQSA